MGQRNEGDETRRRDRDPQGESRHRGRDTQSDWGSPGGSRSRVYDEPPLEPPSPERRGSAPERREQSPLRRERRGGRSQHWLRDDEVPEMSFGRNVGDAGGYGASRGEFGSGGNLRDFTDQTSAGHHAGYGDYGQQDYGPHGAEIGEPARRDREERRGSGDEHDSRSEWDTPWAGQSDDGRSGYGRSDYRGNVGPGGYGYAESSYGPGRVSRGGGQDWSWNQRGDERGWQDELRSQGRRSQQPSPDRRSPEPRPRDAGRWRDDAERGFGSEARYPGAVRDYEREQSWPRADAPQSHRSYRGRGPKGYGRSDERIREVVCEMLTDDPDVDARDITVTVSQGAVTLEGSVSDRWTKYRVEEGVERVNGVRDVRNLMRVHGTAGAQGAAPQGDSPSDESRQDESPSGTQQLQTPREQPQSTTSSGARTQAGVGTSTPKTG